VISPAIVTIANVEEVMKRNQVTELLVTFSGPVNAAKAGLIGTYRLATPGKKGSYTAKNAGIIKLRSALYNAAENTVTLTPKKAFALTKPVQMLIYGIGPTALQDSDGGFIDGDHNGVAGGNAVAIVAKKGVTIDAVTAARIGGKSATTSAIDAVICRGELADLRRALRAGRNIRPAHTRPEMLTALEDRALAPGRPWHQDR